MNPFTTTHLKVRVSKLNTIITATHEKLGLITDQLSVIKSWEKCAGRIIIHTPEKLPLSGGFRVAQAPANKITVASMLRSYVVQIPGTEIFAITTPDVILSSAQEELFNHVESQRMERAWAANALVVDGVPKVFIMSAPVLPHLLRDISEKYTFGDREWARYMHEWLGRYMLAHRYFSADQFKIALPCPSIDTIAPPSPVSTPEPVAAPVQQEPVQKKKVKSKKA